MGELKKLGKFTVKSENYRPTRCNACQAWDETDEGQANTGRWTEAFWTPPSVLAACPSKDPGHGRRRVPTHTHTPRHATGGWSGLGPPDDGYFVLNRAINSCLICFWAPIFGCTRHDMRARFRCRSGDRCSAMTNSQNTELYSNVIMYRAT